MTIKTKSIGRMRCALLCLLAAMLPVLNSCKKESVNTSDLLRSVPSSASAVVGLNLSAMLDKAGCKVEGSQITPGKEVQAWLASQDATSPGQKEMITILLNGESGIDPVGAIFFKDAYDEYVTVALADTDKFKAFIEKQTGNTFASGGNDVDVCANVAVKGAQAWISGSQAIDAKAVANYSTLAEEQSFIAKEFSGKIANMTNDIVGWGEIGKLMGKSLDFSQMSTMNIFLGMLFDDARSLAFSIDFLKGKATAAISMLNKDGKPAKYFLPSDKIDVATVKSVAQSAEAVGAICITKELVKKIERVMSSFGDGQMKQFTDALKSVDGTAAVAFGNLSNPGDSIRGVITTDGKAGLDLMQIVSSIAPVNKDGKLIRFSKGTVGGALSLATSADYLKDATMGMVVSLGEDGVTKDAGHAFRTLAVAFVPQGGSLDCRLTLEGKDESRNTLLSVIESFTK